MSDLGAAIAIDPKCLAAYGKRGMTRMYARDYANALRDFDAALKLDPLDSRVYVSRALLLASCPDPRYRDGKEALAYAKNAMALTRNPTSSHYESLAAAYAEMGDFAEAERCQRLVRGALDEGTGAHHRLELYRNKQPYRLP